MQNFIQLWKNISCKGEVYDKYKSRTRLRLMNVGWKAFSIFCNREAKIGFFDNKLILHIKKIYNLLSFCAFMVITISRVSLGIEEVCWNVINYIIALILSLI